VLFALAPPSRSLSRNIPHFPANAVAASDLAAPMMPAPLPSAGSGASAPSLVPESSSALPFKVGTSNIFLCRTPLYLIFTKSIQFPTEMPDMSKLKLQRTFFCVGPVCLRSGVGLMVHTCITYISIHISVHILSYCWGVIVNVVLSMSLCVSVCVCVCDFIIFLPPALHASPPLLLSHSPMFWETFQ
jgi:hypothetical protein